MRIAGLTSGASPALRAIRAHRPGGAELAVVVSEDADAPDVGDDADARTGPDLVAGDPLPGERLGELFDEEGIDLVVVDWCDPELPGGFPAEWPRTVGTYPSLLPAFEGAEDPVAAALDAGVAVTGATVHELGAAGESKSPVPGRILAQQPVFVGGADAGTLRERVATATERTTVRAIRSIAGEGTGDSAGDAGGAGDSAGDATGGSPAGEVAGSEEGFPATWLGTADRSRGLRYGENPHQDAALYAEPSAGPSVVEAPQLNEGARAMSYNNYNDADGALGLVGEFDRPAAAVIKHTNPAGCATAGTIAEAYDRALSTDPMSAFGGIVALNRPCDAETARAVTESFKEVVLAPGYTDDALAVLREEDTLRVLDVGEFPDPDDRFPSVVDRPLAGGRLLQDRDLVRPGREDLEVVTEREPTDAELDAMLFAWRVVTHVKSNAIVFATGTETVGIGAGQMSRVDAVEIAAKKADEDAEGKSAEGSVMASDAFFPFPDAVEAAAEAGVEAVIQPGGSVNDDDVIDAADDLGLAMALTDQRAFRHD